MSKSTSNEVQDRRTILKEQDPEIFEAIQAERKRQNEGIELIASENYVSPAVLSAMGSVLTNKYAEGVPGHRYYGGCQWVDVAENLAIDRVKKLFGAEHANVQPHAGAQANAAAYFAMIQPGDAVLALKLDQGGHLTHGSNVNFSGKLYKFHQYGVHKDTERIDYEEVAILAEKFRPRLIVTGASAYPRFFDFPKLRDIADSVGAYLMMDMAHIAGLIAAGLHPNPIPYCDVVTSTTHKTLRGPRGGLILCKESLGKKVDSAVFPGLQGGPLMHIIAAKAVAFGEALKPEFKLYAQQILNNAQALASGLLEKGLRLVSGGTDNHLMLVDLRSINVSGKDAETALDNANIHTNKNMIPYDPAKPTVTSGIRLGSQCCATRGMGEDDMKKIANWIYDVIAQYEDTSVQDRVRSEVINFCSQFPIPGIG